MLNQPALVCEFRSHQRWISAHLRVGLFRGMWPVLLSHVAEHEGLISLWLFQVLAEKGLGSRLGFEVQFLLSFKYSASPQRKWIYCFQPWFLNLKLIRILPLCPTYFYGYLFLSGWIPSVWSSAAWGAVYAAAILLTIIEIKLPEAELTCLQCWCFSWNLNVKLTRVWWLSSARSCQQVPLPVRMNDGLTNV